MLKYLILLGALLQLGIGAELSTSTIGDGNCVCSCGCLPDENGIDSCECSCNCGAVCESSRCGGSACTAGVDGPNVVTTYDGAEHQMNTSNIFVVSEWMPQSSHQCKFIVYAVTEALPDGSPQLAWIETSFGVGARNHELFERHIHVSQTQGVIEIGGHGFLHTELEETSCYQTGSGDEAWTLCIKMDTPGGYVISGEVPSLGCWYSVRYTEGDEDGSNDQLTVEASQFYSGQLEGMCGNRDGNPDDDNLYCHGNTGDVSVDCIDTLHL